MFLKILLAPAELYAALQHTVTSLHKNRSQITPKLYFGVIHALYVIGIPQSLIYVDRLSKNDEKLPYLHRITKRKFLVRNTNMGLCLYLKRRC